MLFHKNTQNYRSMQLKYKAKYKSLKREIKNLVVENAALVDEVAQVQADLYTSREERRYLAKRLLRFADPKAIDEANDEAIEANSNEKAEGAIESAPKKRGPKKRAAGTTAGTKPERKKPKTTRERTKLSVNMHTITVHTIGEIIPINPNFHTENSIYPVGYVATRIYAHPLEPQRKCVYTCKILNNSGKPQFQIIPDNDLDSVFFGDTADTCHQELLEILQRSIIQLNPTTPFSLTVQGDKFFGLKNNMVKALLQMDPGFTQCAHFKGFPPMEDNTLPEESDPALSYDALQSKISIAPFHIMPELRDLPPDQLLHMNLQTE